MKIWRALWQVAAAMHYCSADQDPSFCIRRETPKGRSATGEEGEVVRLVKEAWRRKCHGLACIIAIAYDAGGRRTDRFPADLATLRSAVPVYRDFPGFEGDLSGCRTMADLPPAARAFVDAVAEASGVPVRLVSVGADRAQYLTR